LVVPRQNALKTKSPFRAAIESGSDVESIDFEVLVANEVEENPSSGSSTLREYGTDFDSVSTDGNTSRADPSSGKASTIEEVSHRDEPEKENQSSKIRTRKKSQEKSLELKSKQKRVVAPPEKESESSRRLSSRSLSPVASHKPSRKGNERKLSSTGKNLRRPAPVARNSSEDRSPLSPANDRPTNSTDDGTQTEEPKRATLPRVLLNECSPCNEGRLRTHLQLLKEFNRLEWTSLQEWNAILDDIREKYDGPSTAKLKAVIERRTNQFNMMLEVRSAINTSKMDENG
ncbi:hypothetical protein OSTOST_19578, partial [Ostertagia ostertagi]